VAQLQWDSLPVRAQRRHERTSTLMPGATLPHGMKPALCIVLLLTLTASCGGCDQRAAEPPANPQVTQEREMEEIDLGPMEPQFLRLDDRLLKLGGELDEENRYLPAVLVDVMFGEEAAMWCSGVALSRWVVLTAGHCVCARKPLGAVDGGSPVVIDASACSESAKVTTHRYYPPAKDGSNAGSSIRKFYEGRVQPHPELRVTLDEQGRVSTSHADLALVFLSKPLEVSGFPLADEEVRMGESIIIVGRDFDEVVNVSGVDRRVSTNKVTRLMTAGDERVLIEQPGRHRYRMDSGGPCLRQGRRGPTLVGISSRWLGEGAAFTSIHDYRAWLRDAVQRAEAEGSRRR
jgi:secreted trypsin-like serine protease